MKLRSLLAGDAVELARITQEANPRLLLSCGAIVIASCAVYGFTFGLWRSGAQAICTSIKLPLVILLTCGGNAMLNGCLAMVLGAGIGFRQSGMAILLSFTITGLILASFAPLMLFLNWNLPGIASPQALTGKHITLLAHVSLIAFAGIVGNLRLWQLLARLTSSPAKASTVLFSWLAGNLLLGSQISWILRPWVGRPSSPVSFFSEAPLEGNFFEAVWSAASSLILNAIP